MKKITPLILLLALVMLLSFSSTTISAATGQLPSVDYSDPNSPVVKELMASEFLKLLVGGNISSLEAEFLDSTFGEVFKYSDVIPQKNVETVYSGGTLSISASVYEYKTIGGTTVSWKPTQATLAGKKTSLSYSSTTKKYEGKIENVAESEGITLVVDYSCDIVIASDIANAYKNYTYQYAMSLCREEDEYKEKLEAYNVYQQYLAEKKAYDDLKASWDKYYEDKDKYDKKEAEYQKYLKELEEYNKKYAEFEAYNKAMDEFNDKLDAYNKYLEDQKKYDEELKVYNSYAAQFEEAEKRLAVLDSIFVTSSEGKRLYGTLVGGMLERVMTNLDKGYEKLQSLGSGISRQTIVNTCNIASSLKTLLIEYNSKSTLSEKFNYYKDNYTQIKTLFKSLCNNLENMWRDEPLKTGIMAQDNGEHYFYRYIETLLQIYVVQTGLDDSVSRNPDWYVKGEFDTNTFDDTKHYFKNELESALIPADLNKSDPSDLDKLPEGLTEPTKPTEVEKPTQPEYVGEPTEPEEKIKPQNPPKAPSTALGEPPKEVSNPGSKPTEPSYTTRQKSLMSAIRGGSLLRRAEGSSVKLTFNTNVSKQLVLEREKCIVSFYDYDGKTLLYSYTVSVGESISYSGKTPTREQTDKNTYSFDGWKNESGEKVSSFGKAEGTNINFYASYSSAPRTYTITWKVNGVSTTETYTYGATPEYKGELKKDSTAQYSYSFSGWNNAIAPVEGNATYEAMFEATIRKYKVSWKYGKVTYTDEYEYGAKPTFSQSTTDFIEGEYIYKFTGWDKAITAVTGETVYTANFEKVSAAKDENGNNVSVELKDNTYIANATSSAVYIDTLVDLALAKDSTVALDFEGVGAQVMLSEATMLDMKAKGCKYVYIYINEEKARSSDTKYSVRFVDGNGKDITLKNSVTVNFTLNGKITSDTRVYLLSNDGSETLVAFSYENGAVSLKLKESSTFVFKTEYKITVNECENGSLSSDKVHAYPGEVITLTLVFPKDDYVLDFIKVVGSLSGNEYVIENVDGKYTFTMQEEAVTVSALLKLKEYKVTFIVDGEIVAEQIYHKGDKITPPEVSDREGQNNTVYTFTGWSPLLVPVMEDATYTAVFKETVKGDGPMGGKTGIGFYFIVAGAGIVALLVLASPIVITIVVKKRKKQKLNITNNIDKELE